MIDLRPHANAPSVIRAILAFYVNSFYARMVQLGESSLEKRAGADGVERTIRQIRRLILVDEADDFISLGINGLKNVLQQGRAFGCGVFLSTQFLHHFNKADPPLRQLIGTWILHQMPDASQRDLQLLFGVDTGKGAGVRCCRESSGEACQLVLRALESKLSGTRVPCARSPVLRTQTRLDGRAAGMKWSWTGST